MNPKLKEKVSESLSAVIPITLIVLAVSVLFVPMELGTIVLFLGGAAMLIIGMGLFQLGAEIAMTPLGEGIGSKLSRSRRIGIVIVVAFIMGIVVTVAEPDLQVLANQVPAIPDTTLIWVVAIGVGIFLAVAISRILLHIGLNTLLLILYGALLILSLFVPNNFLAVAFDAGGVTTGPITVPFIMALGLGLASARADKNASDDSFGLVALSSIGPIVAVMALGCFFAPQSASYSIAETITVHTTRDVAQVFAAELPHYAKEVFISILPLLVLYLVFQLATRHFTRRQQKQVLVGLGYTYLGLVLFMCGVNVGFAPVGSMLGSELAALSYHWILIPIGMLIGYYIVKAEPAIQVLNRQVQTVTSGAISSRAMNLCMSIGVCISVGLSMLRVLTGLPIQYIIIPGYIIALILTRKVPSLFVGIAFDSGGVASGPMTSTFLLPLCLGACEVLGGEVMTDAFGVVAMVALTPLIVIQIMGLIYQSKLKRIEKQRPIDSTLPDDIDDIIDDIVELEEE